MLKIRYDDVCTCGWPANQHTRGLFYGVGNKRGKRSTTMEQIKKYSSINSLCTNEHGFKLDNIKYLESRVCLNEQIKP